MPSKSSYFIKAFVINSLHHLFSHQTKISCTIHNIGIWNFINNLIKFPRKPTANLGFPLPAFSPGCHTIIFINFKNLVHLLAVKRVNFVNQHLWSLCSLPAHYPRIHGSFFSTITGKGEIFHMLIHWSIFFNILKVSSLESSLTKSNS